MTLIFLYLQMELNKLYCNKLNDKINDVKMETDELLAVVTKDEEDAANNASHGESLLHLKQLPILEKVKKLLIDGKKVIFAIKF